MWKQTLVWFDKTEKYGLPSYSNIMQHFICASSIQLYFICSHTYFCRDKCRFVEKIHFKIIINWKWPFQSTYQVIFEFQGHWFSNTCYSWVTLRDLTNFLQWNIFTELPTVSYLYRGYRTSYSSLLLQKLQNFLQ